MNEAERTKLYPRELVVLAEDYEAMVAWYVDVLGFRIVKRFAEGYRYSNLETESGLRIGIAPASEAGVTPGNRAQSCVLLQVEVPDVEQLFRHLKTFGANIIFGPSYDKSGGFWFGGFADLEGNPIWVVDTNCP